MLRSLSLHTNSTIVVTLSMRSGSSGSAVVVSSYAPFGAAAASRAAIVAPGGTNQTTHLTIDEGIFRIVIDMKSERDIGMLEVTDAGAVIDSEQINGDTTWVYTVE